jgi:phage-related protein
LTATSVIVSEYSAGYTEKQYIGIERGLIVLDVFSKKTQKTPQAVIDSCKHQLNTASK